MPGTVLVPVAPAGWTSAASGRTSTVTGVPGGQALGNVRSDQTAERGFNDAGDMGGRRFPVILLSLTGASDTLAFDQVLEPQETCDIGGRGIAIHPIRPVVLLDPAALP